MIPPLPRFRSRIVWSPLCLPGRGAYLAQIAPWTWGKIPLGITTFLPLEGVLWKHLDAKWFMKEMYGPQSAHNFMLIKIQIPLFCLHFNSYFIKRVGNRPKTGAQCAERILNRIVKPLYETFTGLMCKLQGFRICFVWNPRLKGIESTC